MEPAKRIKRYFTPEQKLNILELIDYDVKNGMSITGAVEKNGIVHSVYRQWKKKFIVGVKSSLRNGRPALDQDKRRLERENERLREVILSQSKQIADLKKETNWV